MSATVSCWLLKQEVPAEEELDPKLHNTDFKKQNNQPYTQERFLEMEEAFCTLWSITKL